MEAAATIVIALVMFDLLFIATNSNKKNISLLIIFNIFVVLFLLMVGCASQGKYTDKPDCIDFKSYKYYHPNHCSIDEPLIRTGWIPIPNSPFQQYHKETDCVRQYDSLCRKDRGVIDSKSLEDKKTHILRKD